MKPVICNYYLTYRCNARCGFCSIWKDASIPESREASPDVVSGNLADVKHAGVRIVDFTGGEPLLYEGLPEVLYRAKKLGLKTSVTSNGIRYPERAAELAGHIDILQFSIDAATKENHDKVTGVSSFERVMESVEKARTLGERPTFIHTVTDENLTDVPDVISLAQSLRIPLFLNPCFTCPGNQGLSRKGAVTLGKLAHGNGVTIDRGYLRFCIDGGNRRIEPRCMAVSSTIVISPDDHLILPCFHYRTKTLPICGNLSRLLESDEVRKQKRTQGTYQFCEGCTVYCYMRASLFRKLDGYFLPSIMSACRYLYVYFRSSLTF